jgi:hypothetical protein
VSSTDFRALKEVAAGSEGGVGGAHLPHNLVVGDVQGGGRSFAGLTQLTDRGGGRSFAGEAPCPGGGRSFGGGQGFEDRPQKL